MLPKYELLILIIEIIPVPTIIIRLTNIAFFELLWSIILPINIAEKELPIPKKASAR
jgi:hypothetical protein